MASLAGKADSSIIAAAYRASLANVPQGNLTLMETIRNTYKSTMDNVEGVFKNIQAENEAYNQEMLNALKPLNDTISDGTFTTDVMDLTADDLSAFRQEWKNIPKGPKGEKQRIAWRSKINKYTSALKAENQKLSTINAFVLDGQHNIDATGGDNIQFLTAVTKYWKNEEGGATRSTQNGEIVYTANINGVEISKTQTELDKLITPKDWTTRGKVQELINSQVDLGNSVAEYDPQDMVNRLDGVIMQAKDSESAYHDFIHSRHGSMEKTIAQEIHSLDGLYTDEIFTTLNDLNMMQQYDIDGDGLGEEDFTGNNAKNYLAFAKSLTDPMDENFSFKLSKEVAFSILSAGEGKDAFDLGKNTFDTNNAIRLAGKTKPPPAPKETVALPWGDEEIAKNSKEIDQLNIVEAVIELNENIKIGNDIYTLQENGNYRLTQEWDGKNLIDVDSKKELTRQFILQTEGGRFGKAPKNFDWGGLKAKETARLLKKGSTEFKYRLPTEEEDVMTEFLEGEQLRSHNFMMSSDRMMEFQPFLDQTPNAVRTDLGRNKIMLKHKDTGDEVMLNFGSFDVRTQKKEYKKLQEWIDRNYK